MSCVYMTWLPSLANLNQIAYSSVFLNCKLYESLQFLLHVNTYSNLQKQEKAGAFLTQLAAAL